MSETSNATQPVPVYYCRACPEVFATAEASNAHHDATGHHQTWKPQLAFMAPRPVSPEAAPPMEGRCVEIDARTVTRESLVAQGVKPDAADELIAYANALLARHGLERYARHADDCAWRRTDPAGCDCGLARLETTIDTRTTTPPSPYTIHA